MGRGRDYSALLGVILSLQCVVCVCVCVTILSIHGARRVRHTFSFSMNPLMLSLACFTATLVSLLRTDTNSVRSLFVAERADADCEAVRIRAH